MAKIEHVSPLAPAGGFPDMPAIEGIRFSAVAAGLKYQGRTDVMLADICAGATVAGVFTKSATRAAPVLDCQDKLGRVDDPKAGFAFLVNAGNANAFTGKHGTEAVNRITSAVGDLLGIPQTHVYSASTGVIGEPLPTDLFTASLDALKSGLSEDRIADAAEAIRTTDTFAKGSSAQITVGGATVSIAGIAKGSGMIEPDMATMLVYIFTDAKISQQVLQASLSRLNETTFNCITVDSDTSTSDTLLMAATGKAEMAKITDLDSEAAAQFCEGLRTVMTDLAHQVVRDGEGASKFVTVQVTGAASDQDAHKVAKSVANSPLVKTAIAGEDPNWGRVVMAVGKSGAEADRDRLSIRFGDLLVAEQGWVSPEYSEAAAADYMKNTNITIRVDLGLSGGSATIWTCDLTHGYISINADYRS
ncbi:bifunctional glutamate N-acetyltransferase/amino-acid acetyltransferase ArgJ [Litoreibacter roseus]|uniref:Arginine biosynthesis bifunctional protein ArgJ n=1 Tax=Litoreibacter roseus TaxID=2601869 RepID=A0A6N6JDU5_9RHOB|nr:bifunctional glutamate N-acetyltransferase/amino-acid acetyltransferase ArgJ [Litoreibacter roseus]GFE64501.1 arginine biosynthesis bifunctional protein ArgJ [Litoreibacter roseus]